ncbi:speckle-type POZ protein A-like [Denticeps clupeoides]|uniref:speckle-type POZ protein A-like n=1 Tax=Denticeps clupeoides TaxID=299321 RepID=UPI0010A4A055|nr:speckle-type POZ protein A-like [Denticeps clupeoides]
MALSYDHTQRQVDKYSYVWTISSFSFADDVNGVPIMSSTISNPSGDLQCCSPMAWSLTTRATCHSISFWSDRGVRVSCKLAMLNAEGQEEFSLVNQYDTRMYENDKLGFPDFVHRSDILDDDLGFLKDDTLTLTCEFTVEIDPDASTPQVKKQEPNMAEELRELWNTSLHSDCILSVAGQEFKAHKAILAARCPVFHSMFMNNTKENQTGRVDIKDMEADILEEMITYIYTGTSPNVHQMASKLIAAADMVARAHIHLQNKEMMVSIIDYYNFLRLTLNPSLSAHTEHISRL